MFFVEEFSHLKIQLQDVISATDNFSPNKLIGHGGFGQVYKGELYLPEGRRLAAIKRLDCQYGQGNAEFWKEVTMLSKCKHENLISLLHFCFEGDERILVYEYAARGSLDRHLSDATLTWIQRLKISIRVARGLNYLHDPMETKQRVLHRDIKSSNILLDEEWNAKVSDFGLSKVGPANQQNTYLVSNAAGTFGYFDPSYFETRLLSKESDVYSFGVVLFEMMCGRLCCEYRDGKLICILVPIWKNCFEEHKLDDIIFHDLKEQIQPDSLMTFSTIANRCLQRDHKRRPTMVEIVQELEVAIEQQLGVNTKSECYEIKQKGVTTTTSLKGDEVFNISFKELPLLIVHDMRDSNSWFAVYQGFTSGRRLPVIPSDEGFTCKNVESFTAGTHLLVSGKDDTGTVIWRYELSTNKWYKAPSMITPRSLFASTTYGYSAFVAGGSPLNGKPFTTLNTAEKYDVKTRSWSQLPRMKKPRKFCSGCYMDNKFYVIGGYEEFAITNLKCGEFFDPETNEWTLITGMLEDINHDSGYKFSPLVAVVNNELYAIDICTKELKVYLKSTNNWKALGSVPVRVGDNKRWGVFFMSFCNELLLIGEPFVSSSTSYMEIYTCIPEEPQSDHLPEWKLRDHGNNQFSPFISNCHVMQ